MRIHGFLISLALAALAAGATPLHAATFGTVVPIGGHASDIALDESRNVLYIANLTANRIEVMSTADYSIRTSMNVSAQPGSVTLSPDNQFLLVTHHGAYTAPLAQRNAITLINLNDDTRQTFAMGDTPLAAAFIADGRAFIVTTTSLLTFDPISGAISVLATFPALAKSLPVAVGTFPSAVLQASMSTSPDRKFVYGIADDGNFQAFYRYDAIRNEVFALGIVAKPRPLPRIGVSADGAWAMVGQYKVDGRFLDLAQFPNSDTSENIGGAAVDSKAGVIYAQILTASAAVASQDIASLLKPAEKAAPPPPVLSILDADNLTLREQLSIPEHIVGRASLNSDGSVLYAVTDSGVTVMPVGRLNQQRRLMATQSDIMAAG